MKKSLFLIVSLVLLLFSASSYSIAEVDSKIGHLAPDFYVQNDEVDVNLKNLKGKYVLLSFWDSADADSRIANMQYSAFAENSNNQLTLISVNYDRNEIVYREIIKRDKLQTSSQFHDQEGKRSGIYSAYHLDQGYKSYLISPAGEIIAENPDAEKLAKLLCQ